MYIAYSKDNVIFPFVCICMYMSTLGLMKMSVDCDVGG